jgi:hypothetical protein
MKKIEYTVSKYNKSSKSESIVYFFDYAIEYPHNPDSCEWCPHVNFKQLVVTFTATHRVEGTWYSLVDSMEIADEGLLLNMEKFSEELSGVGMNPSWNSKHKINYILNTKSVKSCCDPKVDTKKSHEILEKIYIILKKLT